MMFVQMTVSAALIIIATAALRRLCLTRLPKSTFLTLWAVALARLLVPFELPTRYSIYTLVKTAPTLGNQLLGHLQDDSLTQGSAMVYQGDSGLTVVHGVEAQLTAVSGYGQPLQAHANGLPFWMVIWCIGFFAMAAFFVFTYRRTSVQLSEALPIKNSPAVDAWLAKVGLRRSVKVLRFDQITAPVSIGVWRLKIILPAQMDLEDEASVKYIMAHELEHLRHFDTLWKLLAAVALCLHWFNPCVWLMIGLLNRDLELACDERVLRRFEKADREPYALSLLSTAEKNTAFTPLYNNYSKHSAEERIRSVMKYKRMSGIATAMAVLLVLVTVTVFATSPISQSVVQGETHLVESANLDSIENVNAAELYRMYEEFGLSYDHEKDCLYYEGQLVRYFEDVYPVGDGAQVGRWHFTAEGTVDVYGVRDFSKIVMQPDGSRDPSGELTGLRRASQEKFTARDVTEFTNPQQQVTAAISGPEEETSVPEGKATAQEGQAGENESAGALPTNGAHSLANRQGTTTAVSDQNTIDSNPFEEYEPYGLIYNEEEMRLYYEGKLVRYFEDILQTGPSSYKRFMKSTYADGEIDLHAVHDKTGKLTGVTSYGQEEFAARTEELKELFQ